MPIDWGAVGNVAGPVVALMAGALANRWADSREVLGCYLGHVSTFKFARDDGRKGDVFAHSLVLRNLGRRSVSNVRINHPLLPDFDIKPSIEYRVEDLPDGSRDIVIPTLVARETITVSYLYFPPVTWQQVTGLVKHDKGFAKPIPVLLQRQFGRKMQAFVGLLLLSGAIAIGYILVLIVRWLIST